MRHFIVCLFLILICASQAQAITLFSNNLDGYDLWDGCPDNTISNHLLKADGWWDSFSTWTCGRFSIVDDNGDRVFKYVWPASMTEFGPSVDDSATAGLGSVYVGFKWRHDAGWDWGSDATHKWIYFPETGGNRTMLSIVSGAIKWFDGTDYNMATTNGPATTSAGWLADDSWHSIVIYASPATSTIRVWYDFVELSWAEDNTGAANYGGTTFDSGSPNAFTFGYQSRPDWGTGNVSYFDDIIVATTLAEVYTFLGNADITCYLDADGDLYSDGTTEAVESTCSTDYYVIGDLTATSGDCDDSNASINPAASEVCGNAVDEDCDGTAQACSGSTATLAIQAGTLPIQAGTLPIVTE